VDDEPFDEESILEGLEQYSIVANRRQQWDTLLWQMPTMALTGEAFLFTISLGANTSQNRRVAARTPRRNCGASLALRAPAVRTDRLPLVARPRGQEWRIRASRTLVARTPDDDGQRAAPLRPADRPLGGANVSLPIDRGLVLDHGVDPRRSARGLGDIDRSSGAAERLNWLRE